MLKAIELSSTGEAVQPLQKAPIISQTLGEESTLALCNWLLKLAQALMPAAYIRLRRRLLIGSGVCRVTEVWRCQPLIGSGVRWIFSPRV